MRFRLIFFCLWSQCQTIATTTTTAVGTEQFPYEKTIYVRKSLTQNQQKKNTVVHTMVGESTLFGAAVETYTQQNAHK